MNKPTDVQVKIRTTQYHAGRYYSRLISRHYDGYQYRYGTITRPYLTPGGSLAWYGPIVHSGLTIRRPRP